MEQRFEMLFCPEKTPSEYVLDILEILTQERKGQDVCDNIDCAMTAVKFVQFLRIKHNVFISKEDVKAGIIIFTSRFFSTKTGEEIRPAGKRNISILQDGYAEYDDHFGNDRTIAYCARESYGADDTLNSKALYNKPQIPAVYRIINRLSQNNHSSPFEQVNISFKLRMPIFVNRQNIRHRTARLNEISARYTKLKNEMYIPSRERILGALKSEYKDVDPDKICDDIWKIYGDIQDTTYVAYEKLLEYLPAELARCVLPVSTYTELYWNCDLNNLQKYFTLRLDSHAQYEIRQLANAIFAVALPMYPITLGSFFFNRFLPSHIMPSEVDAFYAEAEDAKRDAENKLAE
jgi:thymidylate synthase (FAD)